MAAGDVTNIIVSPAWLWYGPENEPEPDDTDIDVGDDWGGNWDWVGLTITPLTLGVNTTTFEVDVQQFTTPVAQSITEERMTLGTTLAEINATLLALLDGGNTIVTPAASGQRGKTEHRAGGRTTRTTYKVGFETIRVIADGTRLPMRWFFYRATFSRGGEVPFGKGAVAGIPISIEVLADTTQSEDEKLYLFQQMTAEAL